MFPASAMCFSPKYQCVPVFSISVNTSRKSYSTYTQKTFLDVIALQLWVLFHSVFFCHWWWLTKNGGVDAFSPLESLIFVGLLWAGQQIGIGKVILKMRRSLSVACASLQMICLCCLIRRRTADLFMKGTGRIFCNSPKDVTVCTFCRSSRKRRFGSSLVQTTNWTEADCNEAVKVSLALIVYVLVCLVTWQ